MGTTQEEIQQRATRRAEELAVREGFRGPGRFAMRHYTLALSELSPADRRTERGEVRPQPTMAEMTTDAYQVAGAARHQDQLAASYIRAGKAKTYAEAIKMANRAAPKLAERAGAHPSLMPDAAPSEGARHYGLAAGVRKEGITIRRVTATK